ncbi:hypothetical protein T484DRAFT_1823239 [Baffinella frigidus]|nr:hypothetical protein T484DRAFT_1823239 [Cryptophyta sp. CCMP2293]
MASWVASLATLASLSAPLPSVWEVLARGSVRRVWAAVVEFEPEGGDDEEAYTSLAETMLRERRAGVILDTDTMFMYLLPPHDAAGKLLQPPADTCANMLGVVIFPHPPSSQGV